MNGKAGRPPMDIPESLIRYAMENTVSNRDAANFLNMGYKTYKKYAKLYIDSPSGKSLFELHKPQDFRGIPKKKYSLRGNVQKYLPADILAGKCPHLEPNYVLDRLLSWGTHPAMCEHCGYSERRIDGKVPLRLDYHDGDRTNHRADNIRILCYNCKFILAGEWRVGRKPRSSWYKKDRVTPADLNWNDLTIPE